MATSEQVAKVLAVLAAAYPHFRLTEETVAVYARTLGDLPWDLLQAAALQCIAECERFPSVAAIRRKALELQAQAEGVPTAYDAWREVQEAIARVGAYGRPAFSHPLVEQAVNALGWRTLCWSENQTADRARFLECYNQLLARSQRVGSMLPPVRKVVQRLARAREKKLELREVEHGTN